ncbi:tRNA (adenine-N(1)-)-methyltransferase non-catalytic subunit trm6 [Thraustotheca clavata]|uniref:tRNA (adenine(58)-N(1))-methyltransferase non-catalytic subunit TRM6 n=1 Tax=Thraustotheca clavata TaxID=74557 RepID=A0A1V9ZQM3_9STRA|nr:tRNA (adenine-N(1)-)-methyltransferase non-catalytic subunit trm6 [Thraustotheca clavata]
MSDLIREGDTVVCYTSDDRVFFLEILSKMTMRVGKVAVPLKGAIGHPLGTIFEESNKALVAVTGGLFPDPVAPEVGEFQVPTNDNRHYTDTNDSQKLSNIEIANLRASGVNGSDLIAKLVENSDTWDTKTDFSKQKYLKKKQQKYMPRVQMVRCTAMSLCEVYHVRQPFKILNLRADTLGQIVQYANIYAGAHVVVVDTCMGLVTGAIAERMLGHGHIMAGFEGQQVAADTLRRFNFDNTVMDAIVPFPLHYIGQLNKDEAELVAAEQKKSAEMDSTPEEIGARQREVAERIAKYTPEEQAKYNAKKEARMKARENKTRRTPTDVRNLLRKTADSLIIAANYDPLETLQALLPLLGLSKPFVVYCEYLEPLTRAFDVLQRTDSILNLQLNDTWTREYQVLPGRTHPEMSMSAGSGYILSGIKVESSPPPASHANLKVLPRRSNKKQRN